jgi:integrase
VPHLSPPTLAQSEQKAILRATICNPWDHLIYSLALGTGLRLAEIVGPDVGNVYIDDRAPRTRLRIRPEIAKGGRKGDVFLPDALMGKLRKFWGYKARRREGLQPADPSHGVLIPVGFTPCVAASASPPQRRRRPSRRGACCGLPFVATRSS